MTQDDRTAPLAELTAQGRNEDAYIWFREHQEQFSLPGAAADPGRTDQ